MDLLKCNRMRSKGEKNPGKKSHKNHYCCSYLANYGSRWKLSLIIGAARSHLSRLCAWTSEKVLHQTWGLHVSFRLPFTKCHKYKIGEWGYPPANDMIFLNPKLRGRGFRAYCTLIHMWRVLPSYAISIMTAQLSHIYVYRMVGIYCIYI